MKHPAILGATLMVALLFLTSCSVMRGTTEAEVRADRESALATAFAQSSKGAVDTAKNRTIAQASSNLGPIADVVEANGQPDLASATRIQKDSIDTALRIPPADYPNPTVSSAELLANAKAALGTYKVQVGQMQADLAAKSAEATAAQKRADALELVANEEKKKADAVAKSEYWWKMGGTIVGGLATVAAIASRLGLPYAGLVETGLSFLNPVMKQRRVTAETGLAASAVGVQGLCILERYLSANHPELMTKLTGVVTSATGGKAVGIADLFKVTAKAYVIDTNGEQVGAVNTMLDDLKGRVIDTSGGVSPIAEKIMGA